jgi:hypothetical protein
MSTTMRRGRNLIAALSLTLSCLAFGLTTAATADILQIPAITFVNRAGATGDVIGDAQGGALTNAPGTLYAAVPFSTNGAVVCRFILVYRDNDADINITARLLKKPIDIGGFPFDPPIEMAKVRSGGGDAGVARRTDRTITQPVLDLLNAFYYVELSLPGDTLEVLGVQIETKTSC